MGGDGQVSKTVTSAGENVVAWVCSRVLLQLYLDPALLEGRVITYATWIHVL